MLMDEPFSAVDPVVRSELHEFFLGLQRELSKTIILITHDIDEAIKLGDQVAIMRVGGHLAQVGTPQQLLDEPADAFVEGFVGRDRGFRSLSFQSASVLSLDRVKVVRDVETARGPAPILVVDGDARPVGWADPDRPGRVFPLGATFSPERDSLRGALDSALTSRYGLAVAVTGDTGRYAGVVSADTILDKVKDVRISIADSISIREAEAAHEYELLEEPDDAGYEPLGEPEYEYESDDESAEAPEAQDEYEAQYESAQGQYESAQYESAQYESAQYESAQYESDQYEPSTNRPSTNRPSTNRPSTNQRQYESATVRISPIRIGPAGMGTRRKSRRGARAGVWNRGPAHPRRWDRGRARRVVRTIPKRTRIDEAAHRQPMPMALRSTPMIRKPLLTRLLTLRSRRTAAAPSTRRSQSRSSSPRQIAPRSRLKITRRPFGTTRAGTPLARPGIAVARV